ncbi:MAG TPA: DUF354 domain-containing protein [Candidatus Cloacimonadota bacterium]|nr:DUF354 domain-containing protein [Candidatus Cloacimonadota bacterium]
MNILIDIGHPAHVHNFRNLYHELSGRHQITVTCKSVPIITNLLEAHSIPYLELGAKGSSLADKVLRQVAFTRQISKIIKDRKIDLAMGLSFSVVYASKITKADSLLFDDDDQAPQPLTARFASPYADLILSPDVLKYENLKNAIYYPGYHELAYLHPKRFKPDQTILSKYGLTERDKYFILRFSALKAHHDVGAVGFSLEQKQALIGLLSSYGKVFITMEAQLDKQFEQYRMPIEPQDMHSFLHYSQMLVCDGQTMCTEAAMLGVPSFRCNSFAGRVSVLEEEEKKYGLTYAFLPRNFDWMLHRIKELLMVENIKGVWGEKRKLLLHDKIDVTEFWAWFLDNYPESKKIMRDGAFDFNRFK